MRPLQVVLIALAASLLVSLAVVAIQSSTNSRRDRPASPSSRPDSAAPAPAAGGYVPELGEFMLHAQVYHQKLYYAGSASNWKLAQFELEKLRETLTSAGKYHDHWKDLPFRLSSMIPSMMTGAWQGCEEAIRAGDETAFDHSFPALASSCNSCHLTAGRPFIVIQTPTSNAFPDQRFAPGDK